MATFLELAKIKHHAVRSDGAKFLDGVRNDSLNTSWLTVDSSGRVTLGPGFYDELLVVKGEVSDEQIKAWASMGAPFYDPTPVIPDEQIPSAQEWNSKARTYYQPTPPVATAVGDLWVDTDDNDRLYRWDGATWVDITDKSPVDAEKKPVYVKGAGADIEIDKYGIRATRKADGKKTFEIDAETGDAYFRGDITGASGTFADGRVAIGDIGGKPWGEGSLPTGIAGIWGDQAGIYMRGYARLLRWGYAEDEDIIDLSGFSFLANPNIILAPKEMITYLPQQPTAVPRIYTEVVQLSPTEFKVKAKTYIRGAVQPLPTTGDRVSGSWIQPSMIGQDGKRGVYTNHFTCRVGWFASGGHRIRITQYVTNQFNSNGDPINWVQKRSFSHTGPLFSAHSGTLNWDISLDNDVWAIRVDWTGYQAPAGIIYAQAGITKADYRTDAYLDIEGNPIGPEEPSGMSVMYIAYDQG